MSFERDIAKFRKSLRDVIKEASRTGTLVNVAAVAIDLIYKRTREGRGVRKPGGSEFRLKPLSKSYIRFRKANRSRLSNETTPGKSNLTFTGQLLRSLQLKKGTSKLTIVPFGTRADGTRNETVAKAVSKDRPFLALSAREEKEVAKFYRKTFDDLVRRKM